MGLRELEKRQKFFGNILKDPKLKLEIIEDFIFLDFFDCVFEREGKEVDIVLHTAAVIPSPSDSNHKESIALPIIEGTRNILSAVKIYGNGTIKHVVVTSTISSILALSKI